ncbi:MAG: tRNA (adenosine(37)-N6)-dimethylallyltransferase MiaA [Mollicutes bacterium]|nr:tRNA (adenosine(37)-N6)-dimethylallyltransferase MiaA [Mollicutes bacterium]MDD7064689.1 tRNA (adenosine(37)-N6)-dimethylallyltransferase MiaA [Mollicutes bacterium]MDY5298466.1 tRNA (adenosine(37)-N6)-dimethylallyltransferase MiaA [Candidatus Enteromonas sp.]
MILVLTGPTGSGKTDMAISLAKKLGGAIINADAFQVYRELNIATAKPSEAQRLEVPHFLFDFVPISSSYSVYEYQADLRATIADLQEIHKPIIIAGGTGLYIRAGLYDYSFPEEKVVDLSVYEKMDEDTLYAALQKMDPEEAKTIHPHNRIRVLRAIKVYLSSGKKKSEIKAEQKHQPIYDDVYFFGLNAERAPLYERVNQRVEEMFKAGLVEENRALYEKYGETPRAFQAIGVKELFPYFRGEKNLEECKKEIQKNTRHYVKRQETFFRHQFDIHWITREEEILDAISSSPLV